MFFLCKVIRRRRTFFRRLLFLEFLEALPFGKEALLPKRISAERVTS